MIPSSLPVLHAALWFSGFASGLVFLVSLLNGTDPSVAVLRAVGAFVALMLLGLVAERLTRFGLASAPYPHNGPGGPNRHPAERDDAQPPGDQGSAIEGEIVTTDGITEEDANGRP